jgi:hypothetical protein
MAREKHGDEEDVWIQPGRGHNMRMDKTARESS